MERDAPFVARDRADTADDHISYCPPGIIVFIPDILRSKVPAEVYQQRAAQLSRVGSRPLRFPIGTEDCRQWTQPLP